MARLYCMLLLLLSLPAMAAQPDYRAERLKFAADPGYDPYGLVVAQKEMLEEHFRLANDPKTSVSEVNAPLKKLLDLYPLGIQVNFAVADFLEYLVKQAEEPDQELLEIASERREKANAILQSILDSGDGKSADTAYQVINTLEEYAVVDQFGLEPTKQALVASPKGHYDMITAKDQDGTEHVIYFDISLFFGR